MGITGSSSPSSTSTPPRVRGILICLEFLNGKYFNRKNIMPKCMTLHLKSSAKFQKICLKVCMWLKQSQPNRTGHQLRDQKILLFAFRAQTKIAN